MSRVEVIKEPQITKADKAKQQEDVKFTTIADIINVCLETYNGETTSAMVVEKYWNQVGGSNRTARSHVAEFLEREEKSGTDFRIERTPGKPTKITRRAQ